MPITLLPASHNANLEALQRLDLAEDAAFFRQTGYPPDVYEAMKTVNAYDQPRIANQPQPSAQKALPGATAASRARGTAAGTQLGTVSQESRGFGQLGPFDPLPGFPDDPPHIRAARETISNFRAWTSFASVAISSMS